MFNPADHGLESDFRLTKFSTLRGWGCKIPQDVLTKYLEGTEITGSSNIIVKKDDPDNMSIGAGMDSAIIPIPRHNLFLVQTVDFFYPLMDDPKIMGKIALANVLSDVYAVGVTKIDKLSLILSSPTEFTDMQRDIIVPLIVEGFQEAADLADCKVSVKNIAVNPWCMIGGIATSICSKKEIIMPSNAEVGDIIVLTKPLGTQLATNAYIWMLENNEKYEQIAKELTKEDIEETFKIAVKSMTHLNKIASELMHKYEGHAATDVTGFGLIGHAKNLAEFQRLKVNFQIEKLPIIKNVRKIGQLVGQDKKLLIGKAVETSGGLLICLPNHLAAQFCEEYSKINGNNQKAWIIGRVIPGNGGDANIIDEPEIIDVEF